ILSLLDAGALMPLDDLLAGEAWINNLNENDARACILEDTRYCVAHNMRGGITYYHVQDFPDGFPTSAQGWMNAIAQYSDREYFSTQYVGRCCSAIEAAWWPLIYSNGGTIFDEEGKPAWASPEVVEVVQFMRDLYALDALPAVGISGDFSDPEIAWI